MVRAFFFAEHLHEQGKERKGGASQAAEKLV
jgi:hypothetical protein